MGSSPRHTGRPASPAVAALTMATILLLGGCTGGGTTTTPKSLTMTTATAVTSPVGDGGSATSVSLAYPLDSLDEILTTSLPGATITLDPAESTDGAGSLRIDAEEPVTVALVEAGDLDIEGATLFYRAKLRSDDLHGRAYLEMWCAFADLGQYFSRGLDQPVEGTTDWVTVKTPFFLEGGQNPDNVRLNVVVEGTGKVWVDQLELYGVTSR